MTRVREYHQLRLRNGSCKVLSISKGGDRVELTRQDQSGTSNATDFGKEVEPCVLAGPPVEADVVVLNDPSTNIWIDRTRVVQGTADPLILQPGFEGGRLEVARGDFACYCAAEVLKHCDRAVSPDPGSTACNDQLGWQGRITDSAARSESSVRSSWGSRLAC